VDGSTSLDMRVLVVEDSNDWSLLRCDVLSTGLDNIGVGHLMIVHSGDGELAGWVDGDNSHVGACETTVGTAIDERAGDVATVFGHAVAIGGRDKSSMRLKGRMTRLVDIASSARGVEDGL
jgi:hypothetical protein